MSIASTLLSLLCWSLTKFAFLLLRSHVLICLVRRISWHNHKLGTNAIGLCSTLLDLIKNWVPWILTMWRLYSLFLISYLSLVFTAWIGGWPWNYRDNCNSIWPNKKLHHWWACLACRQYLQVNLRKYNRHAELHTGRNLPRSSYQTVRCSLFHMKSSAVNLIWKVWCLQAQ